MVLMHWTESGEKMDSDYSFQFTEKALSDLDGIVDYLVNTLGQLPLLKD